MTDIVTIRKKILNDDDFVLAETKKIQYCFGLKHEIRYGLEREVTDFTESVADHVYAMHVVADYFLPLVTDEMELDVPTVRHMITWHDIDELETGDTISWQKSAEQIANERTAWQAVIPKLPEHIQRSVTAVVDEYEARETPEAKFVKAVDKTEPIFHLFTPQGKTWLHSVGCTREESERIKLPYVGGFPLMRRFIEVVHTEMERAGYFPATPN